MTAEEFWDILHSTPEPKPVFRKLYYSDDGSPIIYTMEDLPGNYIEVEASIYALAPFNVKVVANKLIFIEPPITVKKLQPNTLTGTACCPDDVCVVVDTGQAHIKWNTVNHELN